MEKKGTTQNNNSKQALRKADKRKGKGEGEPNG
jgi:hypothetical protein